LTPQTDANIQLFVIGAILRSTIANTTPYTGNVPGGMSVMDNINNVGFAEFDTNNFNQPGTKCSIQMPVMAMPGGVVDASGGSGSWSTASGDGMIVGTSNEAGISGGTAGDTFSATVLYYKFNVVSGLFV
jgi:hypothetical protein